MKLENIFNNLIKNGVDASNVEIIPNFIDSSSDIFISKDGNNDIKRVDGSLDKFAPDMIDKYSDVILNSKIIVCQLKVPKEFTEKLINFCYDNKKFLILTPCRPEKLSIVKDPSNIDLINKVSLITCNKDEFKILFGTEDIEKTVKLFPNKLIVTLGKDGLIYFDGNNIVKLPAIPTNVVDTVGAGDTLCGNLACSLSKKEDLKSSLEKAMYASAYKIQFHNAQAGMPTKECLHNYIKSFQCEQCK